MLRLKCYRVTCAASLPASRRRPKNEVKGLRTPRIVSLKPNRTKKHKSYSRTSQPVRDYGMLSTKARMLTFRTFATRRAAPVKSIIQASRAAALAIHGESARLLESRYYRTRAKLRLPNQRVRRSERKREGLRLFARHTLKRPETTTGRGKLLLPAVNAYTAVP